MSDTRQSFVMVNEKDLLNAVKAGLSEALNERQSPERALKLNETAKLFEVSKQSILNWMRDPKFPAHYFGSDPRFFYSEIKEWSKANAERKLMKTN